MNKKVVTMALTLTMVASSFLPTAGLHAAYAQEPKPLENSKTIEEKAKENMQSDRKELTEIIKPKANMIPNSTDKAAGIHPKTKDDAVVDFEDEYLKKTIIETLNFYRDENITNNTITVKDLQDPKFGSLILGKPIKNIKHLEKATHLKNLIMQEGVEDTDGLSQLKSLESLSIGNQKNVLDMANISKLQNLKKLHFQSVLVKNVDQVNKLKNVKKLSLIDVNALPEGLNSIEFIKEMPQLEQVALSYNKEIKDFTILKNLPNLKSLNLYSTNQKDVHYLNELTNLKELRLYDNRVKDISFVDHLDKLAILHINRTNVHDLSKLARFKNIECYAQDQEVTVDVTSNKFSLPVIKNEKGNIIEATLLKTDVIEDLGSGFYRFKTKDISEKTIKEAFSWSDKPNTKFDGIIHLHINFKDMGIQTDVTMHDIAEMESKINTITGKTEALKEKVNTLENTIASLEKENANLQDESSKLKQKLETCKADKENVRKEMERLKKEVQDKTGNIADQKVEIKELEEKVKELETKIAALEKEVETLQKDKKDMEAKHKEKEEQLKAKDKSIQELEKKIKKLEKEVKDGNLNANKLNNVLEEMKKLKKELDTLREEKELVNVGLPQGIELYQWYPEEVKAFPTKRNYKHGEEIDLTGMIVRFTRIIKEGNKYIKEPKDLLYREFKHGYKGWDFKLKTTKAIYNESEKGKMIIKFAFTLGNEQESKR